MVVGEVARVVDEQAATTTKANAATRRWITESP
jgi:hypothetical protein